MSKKSKAKIKATLKTIVTEEREKATKDIANKVKGWEDKYLNRLTDRIYKELTADAKDDAKID